MESCRRHGPTPRYETLGGREHVTPRQTAGALAKYYKCECTMPTPSPEHATLERRLTRRLQQGGDCSGPTPPLTMEELCTAPRTTKPREAAGPDIIPTEFLRELGDS